MGVWRRPSDIVPGLILAACVAAAVRAHADTPASPVQFVLKNGRSGALPPSRPAGLGVPAAAGDPDTVFIGHVSAGASYDSGPYHIGRGTRRLTQSGVPANKPAAGHGWDGAWGWDLLQAGELDSLMGWWPLKMYPRGAPDPSAGVSDRMRSWWALDLGNQLNYRSSAQANGVPRTFGVSGLWHRDPGAGGVVGSHHMCWNPIQGAYSAWCGAREPADPTVSDPTPGIGSPYNAQVVQFNALAPPGGTTTANFPGYPGQIDQLLYRDFVPAAGQSITIAYDFVSRMSVLSVADPSLRTGWFDKDPLKPPAPLDANFISSVDANPVSGVAEPPVDSFMVYLAVPVNDAACRFSDGTQGPVFDPLRRWMSEVVAIDKPYLELTSVAGEQGGHDVTSGALTPVHRTHVVPAATVDLLRGAGNGTLRLVFRVKTNRGGDDGDAPSYASNSAGAVVLDNVAVSGGASLSVGFESPGDIDNTAPSSLAFHTTGKPPFARWHLHDLASLDYQDLCGPPASSHRLCNIYGRVASGGDHGASEAAGGAFGGAEQEQTQLIASPTVNLVSGGVGLYNAMGIDEEIASRPEIATFYDIYAGRVNAQFTGNTWSFAFQSYPVRQPNGVKCWGAINVPDIAYFSPDPICLSTYELNASEGLVTWDATASASASHPDSIRVLLLYDQACYQFEVTGGCSPHGGLYVDNVSVGFIRSPALSAYGGPGPGTNVLVQPSIKIWDWFQDAFPATASTVLPGTVDFDTTAAHVKTGLNVAPNVAWAGWSRPVVPGDSAIVTEPGAGLRLDLVFSIKPGPGNYVDPNNRAAGLKKRPDAAGVAVSGDGSFWGQYMANPGERASPGAVAQHAAAPGGWDWNVWNSAREDTAERNYFPIAARGNLPQLASGTWATLYHESDPHGGARGNGGLPAPLALPRNRCFLVDPAGAINSSNTTCGTGPFPPAWVASPGTGYDGSPVTYELTKILPDGLFTPGTHVRYFHRVEAIATGETVLVPDTTQVSPQSAEGSLDGHRWQQFGVLPDAWKFTRYGGEGGLCMLLVDGDDRRGDERVIVGVLDSIGAASPAKWGAHNGWHAVGGGADVNNPLNNRRPDGSVGFRSDNGGQPGTSYDLYGVKAAESLTSTVGAFGSRLGAPGTGFLAGKEARIGPTAEMLQAYYDLVVWLSGDLQSGVIGPYARRTSDDVTALGAFLSSGTALRPRGAWVIGDGFAESASVTGATQAGLLHDTFGSIYRGDAAATTGVVGDCAMLTTAAPLASSNVLGVASGVCQWSNDVIERSTDPSVAAAEHLFYQPPIGAARSGGVHTSPTASRHFTTVLDGIDVANLAGAYCTGSEGRRMYLCQVMTQLIGSLCPLGAGSACGSPVGLGDAGGVPRDFLRLASANPARTGNATVEFGVTQSGRLEVALYDIVGRKVRVLASRFFQPGRYAFPWDGRDDQGRTVPQGVYFYRLKSASFSSAGKLIVLQ